MIPMTNRMRTSTNHRWRHQVVARLLQAKAFFGRPVKNPLGLSFIPLGEIMRNHRRMYRETELDSPYYVPGIDYIEAL